MPIITCPKLAVGDGEFAGKERLIEMLYNALQVELATIPLYLFSMYSINITDGPKRIDGVNARSQIAVVVKQEMLHLALAGNLITSIQATGPKLYSKDVIPTYGGKEDTVLMSGIPLKLERCKKNALERFLQIEAPYEPMPILSPEDQSADLMGNITSNTLQRAMLIPEYHSIGEFYRDLEKQIEACPQLEFGHKDRQFSSADFFDDLMVQITDHEGAKKAVYTIINQGEGSIGYPEAHYQMFLELYQKRKAWECWPVIPDPSTKMYENNKYIYQLSLAFDAAYCYILITIEATWQTSERLRRRHLIGNIHPIMLDILNPLAYELVQQELESGQNAAPTFQYYETDVERNGENDVDKAGVELWKAIKKHLGCAMEDASPTQKTSLQVIMGVVERIPWQAAA
ncbi:hypothetical protein WOLCODRAFT_161778 [Wolfiporia cocos MD-104 SS10]|uniref:Iminophenyl-pyruvate dimer synthase domain-containing protein n=1 Tax=Wolfiporia cocos (strain MD-104) TaxID=742152 RepID=A0A2H3JPZ2_WOLCO|nr:hypothetical protein WOLCODRAFT_161778 [Wolfiporia cocos MD-104 SS10]